MENLNEFGEYTPWPARKTFAEEKLLVRKSIEKQESDTIIEYLKPLVRYWTDATKRSQSHLRLNDEELVEAGFKHLDFALKKYYEKFEEGKVGFKFSTYFEWFIRQGIVEYMKSIEKE